jgi:hypothetical protein
MGDRRRRPGHARGQPQDQAQRGQAHGGAQGRLGGPLPGQPPPRPPGCHPARSRRWPPTRNGRPPPPWKRRSARRAQCPAWPRPSGRGRRGPAQVASSGISTLAAYMEWPEKPVKSSAAIPSPKPRKATLLTVVTSVPRPSARPSAGRRRGCPGAAPAAAGPDRRRAAGLGFAQAGDQEPEGHRGRGAILQCIIAMARPGLDAPPRRGRILEESVARKPFP